MENTTNAVLRQNALSSAKRVLPYGRQYVIIAVYEVLDKYGAVYEKEDSSTIVAEITVYDNTCTFLIAVNGQGAKTELTVALCALQSALSADGINRSVTAVADSISQYLENEININQTEVS